MHENCSYIQSPASDEYFPLSECLVQTLFANDLYFITFYDNSLLQVVKIAMTEIYIYIDLYVHCSSVVTFFCYTMRAKQNFWTYTTRATGGTNTGL